MNESRELAASSQASAVLDDAHVGHIHGAFGTILHGDHGPRIGWRARVQTLLAILGPGLIVMVGDNGARSEPIRRRARTTAPRFSGP
jgi:hypothetical protein